MLSLTSLWVNLLGTGESIASPSIGNASASGVEGEVRTYAGGRQRYIGKAGTGGTIDRTLRLLTVTQVEKLESWCGQTVLVRDYRGQHWWGVFSKVTRIAVKGTSKYDASFTLSLVTQDEGV
jgi:hypothetical protein